MKNLKTTILVSASVLALLILVNFLWNQNQKNYKWWEDYSADSDEPYSNLVITTMLKSYFSDAKFSMLESKISDGLATPGKPGNYLFIGSSLFLDSLDIETMKAFVGTGNRAFISSNQFPDELILSLYHDTCRYYPSVYDEADDFYELENYWEGTEYFSSKLIGLSFLHPDLEPDSTLWFSHIYRGKERNYNWSFFTENSFCPEAISYEPVSSISEDSFNMIRIPYGKGYFYLNTTPILFTNIYMSGKEGYMHAGKVFSHLIPGDIILDEYSKYFHQPDYPDQYTSQNPLQFILAQRSLKWSWYLGLALLGVYVLFRAKRRQRIIPILEENTNTSLEFIKSVGSLYYMQADHKKLALQKMKLFLGFIRDRYHLPTQVVDENLIKRISRKSGQSEDQVSLIFKRAERIKASSALTERELGAFTNLIDEFYRNSK